MSVTVAYAATCTVIETLTASVADVPAANAKVTHSSFNTTAALTSSTTPPVTMTASFQKALSSGAATIDLTSLTGTNGSTVDFTGLKVQVVKFRNPAANGNAITVTYGASNPHLLGGTAFKWVLSPGQEILIYTNDASPDVGSSSKNIDISGTGSQAIDCQFVAG